MRWPAQVSVQERPPATGKAAHILTLTRGRIGRAVSLSVAALLLAGCIEVASDMSLDIGEESASVSVSYLVNARNLHKMLLDEEGMTEDELPYEEFISDYVLADMGDTPADICRLALQGGRWLDRSPKHEKVVQGDFLGYRCFADDVTFSDINFTMPGSRAPFLTVASDADGWSVSGRFEGDGGFDDSSGYDDEFFPGDEDDMFDDMFGGMFDAMLPSYKMTLTVTAPGELVAHTGGGSVDGDQVTWEFDMFGGEFSAEWESPSSGLTRTALMMLAALAGLAILALAVLPKVRAARGDDVEGYEQVPLVPAAGGPPAGWYPVGDGSFRYWDGTAWTEHVSWPEAPSS